MDLNLNALRTEWRRKAFILKRTFHRSPYNEINGNQSQGKDNKSNHSRPRLRSGLTGKGTRQYPNWKSVYIFPNIIFHLLLEHSSKTNLVETETVENDFSVLLELNASEALNQLRVLFTRS